MYSRGRLHGIAQQLVSRNSASVFLPFPLQFCQEGFYRWSTADPKWEASLPAAKEVMRSRAVAAFKKRIAEQIVGRDKRTDVDLCWPLTTTSATGMFTPEQSGVEAESHYAFAVLGFDVVRKTHNADDVTV